MVDLSFELIGGFVLGLLVGYVLAFVRGEVKADEAWVAGFRHARREEKR